ncbi:MAG: inositol-3-phosphate synthase [Candidatus Methanofastidiosa archaeon]|nr:inositol-3-phosphate synthase [Candidatus Methanofastidiosa archaeon]
MSKIRLAIAGVGNCASSLIQGLEYYKDVSEKDDLVPGLMHNVFGDYKISDIEPVAAFDVDNRKIGLKLEEAIFAGENCTKKFSEGPETNVVVERAPVHDGIGRKLSEIIPVDRNAPTVDVAQALEDAKADMLVSYMPVGSEKAARYYAEECLRSGTAFINGMPEFICSDDGWAKRFQEAGIPCAGDDIKSQVGATILHRVLSRLFLDRGAEIVESYQLNIGGNTDFYNMLEEERLKSKRISKTEAVQSMVPYKVPLRIGPSDYVPFLKDNKVCYIKMTGKKFGDIPFELDLKLSVEDSPNSAGVMIDAIRATKIGLDRGVSGQLISISSYSFKHPPQQFPDDVCKAMVEEFIRGERER